MAAYGGPGQGSQLILSVDAVIGRIRGLQLPSWTSPEVDFSALSDLIWFQFLPATLSDGGVFVAEIYLDTDIVLPTVRTPQLSEIRLPIQTAGNTEH